jgi:peroxin-19
VEQQFEKLVRELGDAAARASDEGIEPASLPKPGPSTATDDTFQETIRRTMQRMQESGEQVTAATATDDTDDILAEMLKQMQGGALEGGGEEDISKMLLGMMEQLTNKDILYEPMKELNEKFPGWIEKNKDTVSNEDLERYRVQQALVKEIVAMFEDKSYTDSNATHREYIVERMQKVGLVGNFLEWNSKLTPGRCKQQVHRLPTLLGI